MLVPFASFRKRIPVVAVHFWFHPYAPVRTKGQRRQRPWSPRRQMLLPRRSVPIGTCIPGKPIRGKRGEGGNGVGKLRGLGPWSVHYPSLHYSAIGGSSGLTVSQCKPLPCACRWGSNATADKRNQRHGCSRKHSRFVPIHKRPVSSLTLIGQSSVCDYVSRTRLAAR